MQAPSSRIPPVRAAAVASDLYQPCACLPVQYASGVDTCQFFTCSASWATNYIKVSEKIGQLKMVAPDGKQRLTDYANTEAIFRVIQYR